MRKLYKFEELSEQAKKMAIQDYINGYIEAFGDAGEVIDIPDEHETRSILTIETTEARYNKKGVFVEEV